MVDSSAVASNVDAGGGCSSAAGGGGAGVVGDASSVCNIAFCSCQSGCVVVGASTAFTVCLLHLHSMKLSGEKRLQTAAVDCSDRPPKCHKSESSLSLSTPPSTDSQRWWQQ